MSMIINEEENTKLALIARRWRNRRRMAYIALVALIAVQILTLFHVPLERLKVLEEIITWFFFVMGSIVGSYVGFATLEEKWSKKD